MNTEGTTNDALAGRIFTLPAVLQGRITPAAYNNWVRVKAWALFKRDRKRKLPACLNASIDAYKETVNGAVASSGPNDPYSGMPLRWDLIGDWDPKKAKSDPDYTKEFYRMPTIDHVNPYGEALSFEICSWEVNCCKSFLTPEEFLDLCGKIVDFRAVDLIHRPFPTEGGEKTAFFQILGFPAVYLLPPFLQGVCTLPRYSKWLLARAKELYKRDKKMGRACALQSSRSLYRKAIHAAVWSSGRLDPYTGDALTWDLIGTWDTTKGADDNEIFRKKYALLPTVDHRDPSMKELDFELCSWMINCCKSNRTPEEFVGLCATVYKYRCGG